MLSTTAITALQAWAAQNPEVEHLVKSAQALACRAAVQRVKARAAVKGVDAAAVVWSDAICPQRLGGAAIGAYSMDLQARCQQPAICYTPGMQHRDDVHMAAARPLHEVPVPGGMHTLQSFLMNELKVRTIPRSATCKVQALAVTVQGEQIQAYFGSHGTAVHTLQSYAVSVLDHTIAPPPLPTSAQRALMQQLADSSAAAFQQTIYITARWWP